MQRKFAKANKPKKEKQTSNENTTEYFKGKLYWRIKTKCGPGEPEFSQPIEPGVKNLPLDLRFQIFEDLEIYFLMLTDTSEDSKLVDRRICAKVSTRISTASERRV